MNVSMVWVTQPFPGGKWAQQIFIDKDQVGWFFEDNGIKQICPFGDVFPKEINIFVLHQEIEKIVSERSNQQESILVCFIKPDWFTTKKEITMSRVYVGPYAKCEFEIGKRQIIKKTYSADCESHLGEKYQDWMLYCPICGGGILKTTCIIDPSVNLGILVKKISRLSYHETDRFHLWMPESYNEVSWQRVDNIVHSDINIFYNCYKQEIKELQIHYEIDKVHIEYGVIRNTKTIKF